MMNAVRNHFGAFLAKVMKRLPSCRTAGLTAASCLALPLAGCTGISQPTETDVTSALPEVPALDTVADGQAYIDVARNELSERKHKLIIAQDGFDGSILGGVVLTGLGTALKWHGQSNTRSAIFTAAVLGADSNLSIPQQIHIIDKGMDALQCVESQAGADWVKLYQYDDALEPVQRDIINLQAEIANIPSTAITSSTTLQSDIDLADQNLTKAQIWLDTNSTPILAVNTAVKISVDGALQTTADQLDAILPDGSAFDKIFAGFPTAGSVGSISPSPALSPLSQGSSVVSSGTTQASGGLAPSEMIASGTAIEEPADSALAIELENSLTSASQTLQTDMSFASALMISLSGTSSVISLPTLSCPLAS